MQTNILKGKIMTAGYSQRSLAEALKKSKTTLNRKVNGKVAFTTDEVIRLCDMLSITDDREKAYFFCLHHPENETMWIIGSALCSRLPPGSDAVRPKAKHRKCRASFRPDIPFRPYRFQRHAGKALRPNAVVPGPRGGVPPSFAKPERTVCLMAPPLSTVANRR